jgi:hypothetical protein
MSIYGKVSSGWEKKSDGITYTFEVPAGCTAEIVLPGEEKTTLGAGKHIL